MLEDIIGLEPRNYIGDNFQRYTLEFQVSAASLNKETILNTLSNKNIDEATQNNVIEIIESCEMARFAPVTQSGAEQTMKLAKSTLQKIEKDAK